MARPTDAQLQFDALSLEGSLLAPEWLAKVASLDAPSQTPADYGVLKGLQLRDELGRYWRIAEAAWAEFVAARRGPDALGASHRFARDVLTHVFGFTDLVPAGERTEDGRTFPIAFAALGGHVPVIVGPYTESLDQNVALHGDGTRRRSAWGSLQEYLNAADGALWGIAANGLVLRVGRDNSSMTRPAWLEADLERIFTEQRFADFSVLWLLIHASRFGRSDRPVQDCPLEQWRDAGRAEGSRARESLRVGVEEALLALGQGFLAHPANVALRESFAAGSLKPEAYFNELLRLVYRMIFLLTVEERGILHAPDSDSDAIRLYADGYGMRRLRDRALRHSAHDRHADLWASVRPVFAALGRADGGSVLALPALGGLFAADQCPHLDASLLENRGLLNAVFRLSWMRDGAVLARVNWKDMGVEEFGSVYESLLELVPVVSDAGRGFGFAGVGETAGNARKLTGSYYTPDVLVQQLLNTALEPVVAQRLAEHSTPKDAERALLSLTVVDPACGSGHFLLAASRRLAGHVARLRSGGTPSATEYRHALRDVVTHCIYGVDRNPMALELARVALWLEAYTPDRALGFLDHHLVCGDALLGLLDFSALKDGIPDDAFKALTGDDKAVAKALTRLNRAGRKMLEERQKLGQLSLGLGTPSLADAFTQLDALGDDGLANVEMKRARYAELHAAAERNPVALAADLFVGAFLIPKQQTETGTVATDMVLQQRFPTTATLVMALDGTLSDEHPVAQAARLACKAARVLHWPLAFPQVFARRGFDVVLGNPPWEMMQTDAQEFFAVRDSEIAQAPNFAARQRLIDGRLRLERPSLYAEFRAEESRVQRAQAFVHTVERFTRSSIGRINLAPLFAETADRLRQAEGSVGLVLPSGIATDSFTQVLFRYFAEGRIVSLYDFENRDGIFPAVDSRMKFCLLTLGRAPVAEFAFFASNIVDLVDVRRQFRLAPSEFQLISPNTRTCPTFRSARDAELTKAIYSRVPVLVNESSPDSIDNPWGLSFMLMFMMNTDSHLFLDQCGPDVVPLYEAKMIHQFDHRWATYMPSEGRLSPGSRDMTAEEKIQCNLSACPRYWVSAHESERRLTNRGWNRSWLMGWRDICRATDERTTIASVLPRVGAGNNLPLMLPDARFDVRKLAGLLANLNSLTLDYVARQKVGGTHLNFYVYKQLPVLPPDAYDASGIDFIVPRVIELTYTARDVAPWAAELGYDGEPFRWNPDRRAVLRAELDAWYAHAYGLTRDELRYILDPADVMGADYPSETFRVLKQNEERQFGEYRTRRLVLEGWDRLFGA